MVINWISASTLPLWSLSIMHTHLLLFRELADYTYYDRTFVVFNGNKRPPATRFFNTEYIYPWYMVCCDSTMPRRSCTSRHVPQIQNQKTLNFTSKLCFDDVLQTLLKIALNRRFSRDFWIYLFIFNAYINGNFLQWFFSWKIITTIMRRIFEFRLFGTQGKNIEILLKYVQTPQ